MTNRKVFLIGGSQKFGSGKVISKLIEYIEDSPIGFEFIETQGARLGLITRLMQLPKNSVVIYQPSICFPAFLRDIIIVSILYGRTSQVSFLLLVDLRFKNILFKFKFIRSMFFRANSVYGLATPSAKPVNFTRISIYFENTKLKKDIIKYGASSYNIVHFGYRSKIKGWRKFLQTATQFHDSVSFSYIGRDDLRSSETRLIRSFKSQDNFDIEKTLLKNFRDETPLYLFFSQEDFAPLMVLECGWWGVPIICIKGTKAEKILSRFISKRFFLSVEPELLKMINLREAELAASHFSDFLNAYHEDQFCSDIITPILRA